MATAARAVLEATPDKSNGAVNGVGTTINVNRVPPRKPYTVCLETVPVTVERLPYWPKDSDRLEDAGTARANIAPSNEAPNGTTTDGWAEHHRHETVLQQHCAYWDKDGDGVIWPQDTYNGCRAWGWNPLLCLLATFLINFNLSYPTCPTFFPDPFFRIWLKNIHKDKHGSDSMSYDCEGRFKPQNFEDMFAKYDRGNKGGLNVLDLARALKGQRMAFDFFGWSAAMFEWLATYLLIWPEDGILRKEDVRRVFDGSIFQHKADEHMRRVARQGKQQQGKREPRSIAH